MDESDLLDVLRCYPQIYLACHVDHRTRGRSESGLTSREASFLTHIEPGGTSPAALAGHLGIARSTLSAALTRLARLGLIATEADAADARRKWVRLTAAGRAAIAGDSVLDAARVAAVLAAMAPDERRRAVDGLKLLAAAARGLADQGAR
jgi:DNA-binding MarR family transcriptional regulator